MFPLESSFMLRMFWVFSKIHPKTVCLNPRHPVIPPEVWWLCFRYVFWGSHTEPQEVFGCLGENYSWLTRTAFLVGGIFQLLCWDVSVKSWLLMVFLCVCSVMKMVKPFFRTWEKNKLAQCYFINKFSHLKQWISFWKSPNKITGFAKTSWCFNGRGDPREPTSWISPLHVALLSPKKLDHTLARKNDRPTWCGVIVVMWWCFCGVLVVVFLWWCFCGGVFVVVFLCWCFRGGVSVPGVFVVVFLCWVFVWWWFLWCGWVVFFVFLWWCLVVFLLCFCGGVLVVVFLWCFCAGVLVVVFLWWCFRGGVVVFLWLCFCSGVLVVVFLWWCSCGGVFGVVSCGGVFVVVFLSLCLCGGVFVVVFLWWCFCGSVFVVVFLCWCFCAGVSVVVFLWWCFGGVFVVFLWWCFWGGVLWWCFCGGVFVVVFLSLCLCGGVFVVVFLWWCFVVVFLRWCFCGGVSVVVFLWWCFLGVVAVVFLWVVFLWWCTKYYSSTTKYYSVLQSTTPYYKVLLQYYSVLQSTTPVPTKYYSVLERTTPYYKVLLQYHKVLLRTTKYYSSTTKFYSVLERTTPYYKVLLQCYSERTTPYYKVLLQCYSVLQSTTPVPQSTTPYYKVHSILQSTTPYYRALLRPLKRRQNDVLPVLLRTTPVLQKLPKTSISCEASATFQETSFPKRAFRARLPPNFTERASKTSVSRDASDNFHRKSFQKDRFVRCFLQNSQKKLPKRAFRAMLPPKFTEQAFKTSVSRDASDNFHRKSFQNDHFVQGFLQIS